ncbi:hypothetical protein D9M73_85560 [compost metagenome]
MRARFLEQQGLGLLVELRDALLKPRQSRARSGAAARYAQQIGDLRARRHRDFVEQCDPRIFGHRRRFDLTPQSGQVEQALGDDEHRRDVAHRRAFFLGEFERIEHAHAVDDAVGEFGRDNFAAQPVLVDRRAKFLAHRGRESGVEIGQQIGIEPEPGLFDRGLQRELRGRQQHRQLGPGQPTTLGGTAQQIVIARQPLDRAVERTARLEDLDQADIARHVTRAIALGDRQRQRLQPVILQHEMRDVVGHPGEEGVALVITEATLDHLAVERDLDVDLIIRAVDPGRIVDEVGIDAPAARRKGDTRGLGDAEIRAFADRGGAQILGIDAQPIIGGVADRDVVLGARLHVGADAAEPDQIDRGLEDGRDQRARLHFALFQPERGPDLLRELDDLVGAREHAAALGDERSVVIGPARPRQSKHTRTLGPAGGGVGIRIEEDMAVVERRDDLQRFAEQHAVAEHVARHVATADDADRLRLHVHAALGEVALDADPRALGGDAHRLMVIADRATAGEGVAQPEFMLERDRVGDVGEGCCALIGGNHEIGVIAVMDDHVGRMHHRTLDDIVGDRQQRADEHAVAFGALRQPRIAVGGGWQLLGVEATLGTGRHDHGVLDALRLHQAQDFGAEVVASVGPAQAAACDWPRAQVDALDSRRIDPDFAPWHGRGQAGDEMAVELERQRRLAGGGKGVGAQRGGDDAAQRTQDAVVVDRGDGVEPGIDRRVGGSDPTEALGCSVLPPAFDLSLSKGLAARRCFATLNTNGEGTRRVMRGGKAFDQRGGHLGRAAQSIDHRDQAIGQPGLTQIAEPGAEQHDRCRCHASIDDQAVERVVFGLALQHGLDRILQHTGIGGQAHACRLDQKFMDEALFVAAQRGRQFLDHAEAEILQHRHRVRQGQRAAQAIDFQPRGPVFVAIHPHRAIRRRFQSRQPHNVARRFLGGVGTAIARGETGGMFQRKPRGARRIGLLDQRRLDCGHPAAHHPRDPRVERIGIGQHPAIAQVQREANQRDRVIDFDRPIEHTGIGRLGQHLANGGAARGGQIVARQPHEREQMPPEHAAHQPQLWPGAIGQRHRGQRDILERFGCEGDDQIMRQPGQGMRQRLAGMALGIEAEFRLERGEAFAQHRHILRGRVERAAGPQPGMDGQTRDRALVAHRHHREIERDMAMHTRNQIGFQQQGRLAAFGEPFHRKRARGLGEDRHGAGVAGNTQRGFIPADPPFMPQQRELLVEQPEQQGGPFSRGQRGDVRRHRVLQRLPIPNGGTHIRQIALQRGNEIAPLARIGAFQLDIDHRFGRARIVDAHQRPVRIAAYAHYRVDDAVDRDVVAADRRGNRIDQKGHVVIDDRQPHPPTRVGAGQRLERDIGDTGRAPLGGGGDKGGGIRALGLAEPLQLARKRTLGQPDGQCIRQRFQRGFCHSRPMRRSRDDLKTCGSAQNSGRRAAAMADHTIRRIARSVSAASSPISATISNIPPSLARASSRT